MFIMKKFCFILTVISIGIVFYHIMGYDEDHLVLYYTSPPIWVMSTGLFSELVISVSDIAFEFLYAITVGFWFAVGCLLDAAVYFIQKSRTSFWDA